MFDKYSGRKYILNTGELFHHRIRPVFAYNIIGPLLFLNARTVFRGCSSFLESNSGYPEKYENDGELVGRTKVNSLCHCSFVSA